eukprot:c18194_g1_i3 orf=151-543(-)
MYALLSIYLYRRTEEPTHLLEDEYNIVLEPEETWDYKDSWLKKRILTKYLAKCIEFRMKPFGSSILQSSTSSHLLAVNKQLSLYLGCGSSEHNTDSLNVHPIHSPVSQWTVCCIEFIPTIQSALSKTLHD